MRSFVYTFLFLSTMFGVAQAQHYSDDCGCNASLAKDVFSVAVTEKQQWAFLHIIDKHMFDEYKSDTSVLATIPIAKGLVEASANYSEYKKKSSDYLESMHYTGSYDLDYREMQTFTSPVAYPVWGECMKACATNRVGLFAWKEKEDKDSVVVTVYYHGAPTSAQSSKLTGTVVGGSVANAPSGQLFAAGTSILKNGEVPVIINRKPGKAVATTISAAGFVAKPAVYSAWSTEPPPPPASTQIETQVVNGGFTPPNLGNQVPGCGCGPNTVTPTPPRVSGKVGEWLSFTWDSHWLCQGQGVKNPDQSVQWDGRFTETLPSWAGTAKVKYPKPGSYVVNLKASGNCVDSNNGGAVCWPNGNHCTASGTVTIDVAP